ncbi:MAG: leucyl/phenylalanyl-tRNA--protein transferase [Gammaproteobacteria bacterium]|jgi:leucyl/phenylalanyl-tRNA---protein transferase|nr:leucyl/phenylalanyl-tRNA--protein transferase [Gammaproteobacteria bacterium]MBU2222821.1 leucyl/phenylalanyl-tRNA--protein transferase [Gammaproteobacteria bacterium]MBU2427422.1 leucyl/phenylalanyl-tRNA--protein transferase [Gammaproteobacteria bacterium]
MPIYLPELTADPFWFPSLSSALRKPDGLLAMGGDLSVERLHQAYRTGVFPWFSEGDPLLWWSPSTRAVFAPGELQLNRSLRKYQKQHQFSYSRNKAFAQVIAHCAAIPRRNQSGTWILSNIQQAYVALHQRGLAHSIEVWHNNTLVGGLYGVVVGGLFCGESMFNLQPNTAKLALCMLQQQLVSYCDGWIDCQMPNPFLLQLGVRPLPKTEYLTLLQRLRDQPVPIDVWSPAMLEFA